jgi:fumarate hydratase class II
MKHKKLYRIEKDSLGEVKIPKDKFYGSATQRAIDNFQISKRKFSPLFISVLAQVKVSSAHVNHFLGKLTTSQSRAIISAGKEINEGKYYDHFPVDIFQTGSGTSTNMNMNEVMSYLANKRIKSKKSKIHPNDHVNLGQSSNDVIPTAMHIALVLQIKNELIPELEALYDSFRNQSIKFRKIKKVGRTHLQDALPINLGQEFSGYASQIKKNLQRFKSVLKSLRELPLGGSAVGTGEGTHPKFASKVCEYLNLKYKEKFREAENHFETQSSREACMDLSGDLKALAISLTKITNDIRWMASGPRSGLGEINIPAIQAGSSMMPGKVNPVIAESLLQVCAEVIGNDTSVGIAGQSGSFELNTMMPLIMDKLSISIDLLKTSMNHFRFKCVDSITVNEKKCEEEKRAKEKQGKYGNGYRPSNFSFLRKCVFFPQ